MRKWYYFSREIKHAFMKSGNLVMGIEHFLVAFPSMLLMARLMRENHLESNGISLILMCTGACNILFVLITKFRIPIFFGPSFAFIGFTSFIMKGGQEIGECNIFWGRFLVAVFLVIFTILYKFADGRKYIKLVLPDAKKKILPEEKRDIHLLITVDERISIRDLRRICKYQIVPVCSKKAV